MDSTEKRNLVICRAGPHSLHRRWMGDPASRTYDVWLDAYDDGARWESDPVRYSTDSNTTKWPRIRRLLKDRSAAVARYEAVWCPDDDLDFDSYTAERLFARFRALRLDLAQPSLTKGSFFSFYTTLRHRTFVARFTNYVEVMAPMFSRRALEICSPTFDRSVAGWGLDMIWPSLLGNPRDKVAVIDAVSVTHTRQVASGNWVKSLVVPPREEMAELLRLYGIPHPYPQRHYGGLVSMPGASTWHVRAGLLFALVASLGAPWTVLRHRNYWRFLKESISVAPSDAL
jgi:hypothetical protein